MLGYYIRDCKELAVMEQNPLAPFLNEAAQYYRTEEYRHDYARRVLVYAAKFGDWLRTHRVSLDRVAKKHVHEFVEWIIPRPPERFIQRKRQALAAANRMVALIRAKHTTVRSQSPVQMEVDQYIEHLRRNRGLSERTLESYQSSLEEFLTFCFKKRRVDHSAITAQCVRTYVDGLPYGLRNSKRSNTCIVLRGYFRFLQLQGITTSRLHDVVPKVRHPRAALLPKWLSRADTNQLLQSIDRSRPTGKRDYAAILCMIDLGLRAGDVACITLDDIDWQEGTIRVPNQKGRQPYRLPLPKRLGQALADYLSNGRPISQRREVFLGHRHPRGTPVTRVILKWAVTNAWQRAGLGDRFSGTHILRHSFATHLKQSGVSLKVIADMLGHNSLETTKLYAQVDLPALRAVAQSWPEGQP